MLLRSSALLLILASAGCHSLSSAALSEAHVDAAVGQKVDHDWDRLTDAQRHLAVHKLTRGAYSLLNDADGTEIPAEYADVASGTAVK